MIILPKNVRDLETKMASTKKTFIFIGPESDHWECLSVTHSLTHWLTHSQAKEKEKNYKCQMANDK